MVLAQGKKNILKVLPAESWNYPCLLQGFY